MRLTLISQFEILILDHCALNLCIFNQIQIEYMNVFRSSHLVVLSKPQILLNQEGALTGSLLSCIDKTVTAFGKRLFRTWLARPLLRVVDINDRLTGIR
jgi:DNA mismatch repair ATPase MutS